MNEQQFTDWCQKLKLLPPTVELIKSIRSSPPSRRVQGRAGNVSGVYPSGKMGHTVSFESAKVELWAIYQMEHDKDVIEFYDQPEGFKIKYQNALLANNWTLSHAGFLRNTLKSRSLGRVENGKAII